MSLLAPLMIIGGILTLIGTINTITGNSTPMYHNFMVIGLLISIISYITMKDINNKEKKSRYEHKKNVYETLFHTFDKMKMIPFIEIKQSLLSSLNQAMSVSDINNTSLIKNFYDFVLFCDDQSDINEIHTRFEPLKNTLKNELEQERI